MKIVEGQMYKISGYSRDLWIEDYDVDVDTVATVELTPAPNAKKVLVILDEIDKEHNVCVAIRRSALRRAV